VLCPVCLGAVSAANGVVETHECAKNQTCPMSGREPFEWDERATRAAVTTRSGGRCELCRAPGAQMHHRKNRSQGGRWSPANIMHLCVPCHRYFTEHPSVAYLIGVSVRRRQEPADIIVHTCGGALQLSDEIAPPLPGWAR
jgi:hypothetical protein